MDIYDRIIYQLKLQKKTRRALCDATQISYATLSSLFQRRSKQMHLTTMIKIADFLGLTLDYLVIGDRVKAGYLLSEDPEHRYRNSDNITRELLRIIQKLTIKGKTLLLSKAYELEDTHATNKSTEQK
jgi:transcriptional regulator with XRE-family HTH domain